MVNGKEKTQHDLLPILFSHQKIYINIKYIIFATTVEKPNFISFILGHDTIGNSAWKK